MNFAEREKLIKDLIINKVCKKKGKNRWKIRKLTKKMKNCTKNTEINE